MEEDVLAERILQDLDTILKRNNNLFETFEVIPVEHCTQNKCPVLQVQRHLAIESWCIKHVYQYAYKCLLAWRSGRIRADPVTILEWSRIILLICQEVELAWNIRKELIGRESGILQNELNFCALVLSWKPRSSHAFIHRRWILGELLQILGCLVLPSEIVEQEISVCKKAAAAYNQNYYAWSHRIWVICRTGPPHDKVTEKELRSTEEWIKFHISDHCCFHYRQFLFTRWIQNCLAPDSNASSECCAQENEPRSAVISSLLQELSFNAELILTFEGHETLWYHRRFLLWTLSRLNCSGVGQSVKRLKFDLQQGSDLEVDFVRCCFEASQSDSWQRVLIERHSKWLKSILSIHLPD